MGIAAASREMFPWRLFVDRGDGVSALIKKMITDQGSFQTA